MKTRTFNNRPVLRRFLLRASLFLCHVLIPTASFAAFPDLPWHPRLLALGFASAALADDASAVLSNPAGLVQLDATDIYTAYSDIYGADGLYLGHVSAAFPSGASAVGVSWSRLSLPAVYDEDVAAVAFARQLSGSVAVGACVKSLRSEVKDFTPLPSSKSAASLSGGLMYQASRDWIFAAAADNINEPQISLSEKLGSNFRAGARYHPFASGLMLAEYDGRSGALRAGFEVIIGKILPVRLGLDGGRASFGFGMAIGAVRFDFAVLSDSNLGFLSCGGLGIKL